MKSTHSDISERNNKERVGRLINLFEVKRPRKSPNSTLRKTKSISSLVAVSSDDEESKNEERKSDKTATSSNYNINEKPRRRIKSTRSISHNEQSFQKARSSLEEIERTNKMVDDFGNMLRQRRLQKTVDTVASDDQKSRKGLHRSHHSFKTSRNYENCKVSQTSQSLDRRFNKKDTKKTSIVYDTPCRELISRKRSKEKEKVENTTSAPLSTLEMETYRKKLVQEIDSTLKMLKKDGFIDDEGNNTDLGANQEYCDSVEEVITQLETEEKLVKPKWSERLNMRRESIQLMQDEDECALQQAESLLEEYEVVYSGGSDSNGSNRTLADANSDIGENEENYNTNKPFTSYENLTDDEFGQCLADDLEQNGSYFVEAYNEEGKELIIVEIAVERKAVNFNPSNSVVALDTIVKSLENSDMVFHQKEDKSLNRIDNPKAFVSSESISSGFVTNSESNRSTVYSTESRDSEVFDTDDEGFSLVNGHKYDDDGTYSNRRETICDTEGVIRIERVACFEDDYEPLTPVSRNDSFTQKGTLSYIIDEIKSTERKYVEDLHRVVTKYKPYIEDHTPPHLIGQQCYIFGNIDRLYSKQKQFLVALENCGETVDGVSRTFIDFENLFKMYPDYFKNKPRADLVLKDFSDVIKKSQIKFNERLDLSSYLLTPLQRLGKYKLFLENIEKQLKKLDQPVGSVEFALKIIKREMSKGNDFVAIESIENSPVNKADYGSFKMREKFNVLKPRRFEAMVFLFENIVVFTTCDPKNMDSYNYYTSIKMIDLRIATFEDLTIHLTDFTKGKRLSRADRFTYVLESKTDKVKETWRKAVENILWQQLVKAKESALKMYQDQSHMGKVKTKVPRKQVKSTGTSIFYVK